MYVLAAISTSADFRSSGSYFSGSPSERSIVSQAFSSRGDADAPRLRQRAVKLVKQMHDQLIAGDEDVRIEALDLISHSFPERLGRDLRFEGDQMRERLRKRDQPAGRANDAHIEIVPPKSARKTGQPHPVGRQRDNQGAELLAPLWR